MNPYEILGVDKNTSEDGIKKAYRKLAKQYHPDKNQGNKDAEEKFKEINNAYEILSNPDKKNQYDNKGFSSQRGSDPFHDMNMDDFLKNMFNGSNPFGQQFRRGDTQRGQNIRINLVLSLEDVVKDTVKNIKYKRMVHCKPCNGTGAKNGAFETCSACGGSGYLKHKANGNIYTDCRQCNKTGKIIKDFCTTCFGNAVIAEENVIDITIPAGAYEGLQFEIKSAGNFGKGIAHPGNLIILISEQRHEIFRRIKTDIHFDLFISVFDAIIGKDNMEVPTINGKVKIKLDAGTENGKVLRLQGKGIPDIANQYRMGDQFIHVNVYIPKNMSEDAMDIFKNMSQTDTIGESCAVTPDKIQGIKGSFERMNEFKNLYI